MKAIYKKELKSYFNSMIGYLILGFFMIVLGIYFTGYNLNGQSASVGATLANISFVYLIVLPILTMRLLSEEQKQKTDQLLFSAPIKISSIVLGKFLAVVTIFSIAILVVCTMPLVLSQFGTVLYLKTYSTIFAFWLLGIVMLSIGLFLSSLTESQVVAAVLAFAVNIAIFLMSSIATLVPQTAITSLIGFTCLLIVGLIIVFIFTRNIIVTGVLGAVIEIAIIAGYFIKPTIYESALYTTLSSVSFYSRFADFASGSFNVGSVVYYITFTMLFLYLTVQSIQKRRWS